MSTIQKDARSGETREQHVDYLVNNMNQLVETSERKFEYDNSGNIVRLVSKTANGESSSFEYYDDGKLMSAINVNNDNCTYTYDCLGRLSMRNCTVAGVFIYTYHNSYIFGYGLSSIQYPNGTIVNFIYLPFTSIVTVSVSTQYIYLPLVPPNPILETVNKPTTTVEPLLPVDNTLKPLVNGLSDTVLNTNNKPFSLVQDIIPPIDLFAIDSFTSNLYHPEIPNWNNQVDSLLNSFNNLFDTSEVPTTFEPIFPSIDFKNPVDSLFSGVDSILTDTKKGIKDTYNGVMDKYVDPFCKYTGNLRH